MRSTLTLLLLIYSGLLFSQQNFTQIGTASFYANKFHGRKTASGEKYSKNAFTAAHNTLPFNSYVKVTNLSNQKSVIVRINDRGPFVKSRIIDLSYVAAKEIGIISSGTGKVKIELTSDSIAEPAETPEVKLKDIKPGHVYNNEGKSINLSGVYLQVGSYSSIENTQTAINELLSSGYDNISIEAIKLKNKNTYRLLLGNYLESEVQNIQKKLKKQGYNSLIRKF
ncbi:MAG: septal ring lytic transglycosylase RlpA family protein [Cytophagaceae bacterium]